MRAACGSYLNLWSEIGHEDTTDIDVKLDIFIVFAEFLEYRTGFTAWDMEDRARNAIARWKAKYYKPGKTKSVASKIRKVLQREFFEEAVKVSVKETR